MSSYLRRNSTVSGPARGTTRKISPAAPATSATDLTTTPILYPFYLISVFDLMGLKKLRPHQELLEAGVLVKWDETMRGHTLFVSHQWCGNDDPDPTGIQLATLQQTLRRLMEGKTDVENIWQHQLLFKDKGLVPGQVWKRMLTKAFVWMDYTSLPQPGAEDEDSRGDEPAKSADDELDHSAQQGKKVAVRNTLCYSGKHVVAVPSAKVSVAREALDRGIASLPGYIELSDIMVVLVPTTEHKDRPGEICDYGSWRGRGWCRLELMAAHLSPREPPRIMVVRSPDEAPEAVFPVDAFSLAPGEGEFSCCSRNHDFGEGPVSCDKEKILAVMELVLEAKLKTLEAGGKLFDLRYFGALEHYFFRGLEVTRQHQQQVEVGPTTETSPLVSFSSFMTFSKKKASTRQLEDDGAGRLASLCEVLRWKKECKAAEQAETERTGASLLFWAVLANDLPSVRHLLSATHLQQTQQDINRCLKVSRPDLVFNRKLSPLMIATGLAREEIVIALLRAGADPMLYDANGFDAFMYAAILNNTKNLKAWMQHIPTWDLGRKDATTGMTALHLCIYKGSNKLEAVSYLVEQAGANPTTTNDIGAAALHFAVSNIDTGSEDVLRYLLSRLPPGFLNHSSRPQTVRWRMLFLVTRFAVKVLKTKSKLFQAIASFQGRTPLHDAVVEGNLGAIRILVARPGINLLRKNAQGRAPLDMAPAGAAFEKQLTPQTAARTVAVGGGIKEEEIRK